MTRQALAQTAADARVNEAAIDLAEAALEIQLFLRPPPQGYGKNFADLRDLIAAVRAGLAEVEAYIGAA